MKNFEKYKTAEEREKAFARWCKNNRGQILGTFCKIDMANCFVCQFAWLELEAEQEQPLPCPCCGNVDIAKFDSFRNPKTFIYCPSCGYHSPWEMNIDVAIARHNELCRKWGTQKPIEYKA